MLGLGGAAGLALVGAVVGTRLMDDDDDPDERTTGADRPSTDEAIERVGAAYRKTYPDEDDVEVLRASLPQFDGLSGQEVQEQLGTLRDQVRSDFAEGRIVMVDGWLLAVTEARAAALVSLLA